MSTFTDELEAKAYALVGGMIDLEDFRSWYKLAVVTSAPTRKEPEPEAVPFKAPPVAERFNDYARDIDEPDEETQAHHRRLLGSGSDE